MAYIHQHHQVAVTQSGNSNPSSGDLQKFRFPKNRLDRANALRYSNFM